VLVLISLVVGTFLWCRFRRRKLKNISLAGQEESIPLNSSHTDDNDDDTFRQRKGKERAQSETMFDVGDDDEDDDYRDSPRG
jgi:carboxypeptidase D